MKIKNDKKIAFTRLIFAALGVIALTTFIFAMRYMPAFTAPNFYAEDGSVFVKNIFEHNILGATLTAFNGYLVLGQYSIAGLAFVPYVFFGLPFSSLPLLIACSSCLFLGITASLPFILFRKELGWGVALSTSILIAFTPMPGSDFAIIGTIGNLKFAFLLWAVVFVIYRNIHLTQKYKVFISDGVLLFCILTNGPTVVLLPFILWPYRKELTRMIKQFTLDMAFVRRPDVISALALCLISFIYVLAVYIKGVPEIANYLQAPFVWGATDNIIHRVTMYAWTFSISKEMTDKVAMISLVIMLLGVFVLNKKRRGVFLFGLFAIAVSTIAFVVTRTGIGEHMLSYEKTPDQFFYAQSMVFIFICMWVLASYVKTRKQVACLFGVVAIFILSTMPYGSSFGVNHAIYEARGDIYQNIAQICKDSTSSQVRLPVYPSDTWVLDINKDIACK